MDGRKKGIKQQMMTKRIALNSLVIFLLMSLIGLPTLQAYDAAYLNDVVGRKAVSLGDGVELIMILLKLEEEHTTENKPIILWAG